jgi:hypothetical protein
MNRRQRRAARAVQEPPFNPPPGYIRCIQALARRLGTCCAHGVTFYLPTKDVTPAGWSLDLVSKLIARDAATRALVEDLCEIGRRFIQEPPTVLQLEMALELAGIQPVRRPISDFGEVIPFAQGGDA